MRRKNESLVLTLVRRYKGLSNADLARRSGLAPQTVSVLLRGLEKKGIIRRGEVLRGKRGQPAVPILINPEGGFGVGVDIGWNCIDVALINLSGDIVQSEHIECDCSGMAVVAESALAGIRRVLKVLPARLAHKVTGLGLALPSPVQASALYSGCHAANNTSHAADLAAALGAGLPFPVFVGNDGISACRAECAYGRGADFGNMIYIFLGMSVGAGIFVDGRIIEGRSRDAANLGSYMVHDPAGNARPLHAIASVRALERRLVDAGRIALGTPPASWDWEAVSPLVQDWIADAASGLAFAIVNSCTLIGFSAAIIDGILPEGVLSKLVEVTQARIGKLAITAFEPPAVIAGTIGALAPAIGAANLPIYRAFFSPE